jgi:ABC-type bacteriocin/lantibiotic exporter with double-glycine peptidase domain
MQFDELIHETFILQSTGSSASFQDVVAASRIANANNFIESFPNKYHEQVGERGQALSG